jgi:hypothetical protein
MAASDAQIKIMSFIFLFFAFLASGQTEPHASDIQDEKSLP